MCSLVREKRHYNMLYINVLARAFVKLASSRRGCFAGRDEASINAAKSMEFPIIRLSPASLSFSFSPSLFLSLFFSFSSSLFFSVFLFLTFPVFFSVFFFSFLLLSSLFFSVSSFYYSFILFLSLSFSFSRSLAFLFRAGSEVERDRG